MISLSKNNPIPILHKHKARNSLRVTGFLFLAERQGLYIHSPYFSKSLIIKYIKFRFFDNGLQYVLIRHPIDTLCPHLSTIVHLALKLH